MSRPAAFITDISEMPAPLQHVELDPVALRKMQPMPHPHDVIDNNPDTKPHLAPYADDGAPELPSPATYNPNPASLPTTLVAMLENILAVSNTQKGSAETVIKSLEKTMATKQREALEKEQLQGEYIESVGWYDYMKKLAVCLLAAFSIVVGGTMIADNPESMNHLLTGSAMITSGITSILGRLMEDTNTSPQTANLMFLLSAGFGLVGGTAYLNMSAHTLSEIAAKIAMASISIISGIADLGKNFSQFRASDVRAEQMMLKELIEKCRRIADTQVGYENISNHTLSSCMMSLSEQAQQENRVKKSIVANMLSAQAG